MMNKVSKMFSLKLSTVEKIQRIAEKENITLSSVIDRCVERYDEGDD